MAKHRPFLIIIFLLEKMIEDLEAKKIFVEKFALHRSGTILALPASSFPAKFIFLFVPWILLPGIFLGN